MSGSRLVRVNFLKNEIEWTVYRVSSYLIMCDQGGMPRTITCTGSAALCRWHLAPI
jgi:hypothetical protein